MWPVVGGLISGGASLLGGMFSSETSAANTQANIQAQEAMQTQTEQFNAGQAQIARDYDTQMANTAYQRASKDMQSAGLNPMMMFGSGGPAATPSSPSPSVGTPNMALANKQSPLAGLGDAVKNGLTSVIDAKTIDLLTQKVANMGAEKKLTEASTEATQKSALKTMQNINIDLPKEAAGSQLGGFLERHPDLTTAVEATKYGAGAVGDVGSAAGSVFGGALRGLLGKRYPTKEEDLSVGFDSNAKDKLRKLYTLPEARQKMKDLEDSMVTPGG